MLLNYRRWRVEQYEAVVGAPGTTAAALTAHLPRLMGRMFTEALVVGNVDEVRPVTRFCLGHRPAGRIHAARIWGRFGGRENG